MTRAGFLLLVFCAWGWAPVQADLHSPSPPSVRVEGMDVFWKRPDAKYIRLTFKVWNQNLEDADDLTVRLFVRADNREDWRPIKIWQHQKVPGHDFLVLEYQPGAITDPVLYLGHFDMRLDLIFQNVRIDSREQTYRYQ